MLLAEQNATWENNLYPLDENTEIWVNEQIQVLKITDTGEWEIHNPPSVIEEPFLFCSEITSIPKSSVVFAVNTLIDGEKRYEFLGVYALEKLSTSPAVCGRGF